MRKVKQIVKQNGGKVKANGKIGSGFVTKSSTPGAIRTPDTRFRKPLLYPTELQGQQLKA